MTNAKPEFLAANPGLMDGLKLIADLDDVARDLVSDVKGYGSLTPAQIRLAWYRINRLAKP